MVARTSKVLKYSLEKLGRHYFFQIFVLREKKHFFQFWSASADHLSHLNFGGLFERRSLVITPPLPFLAISKGECEHVLCNFF